MATKGSPLRSGPGGASGPQSWGSVPHGGASVPHAETTPPRGDGSSLSESYGGGGEEHEDMWAEPGDSAPPMATEEWLPAVLQMMAKTQKELATRSCGSDTTFE